VEARTCCARKRLLCAHPRDLTCCRSLGAQVLAATQTPGTGGTEWFQGTADAVRQYSWLFADVKNKDVEDVVILSGAPPKPRVVARPPRAYTRLMRPCPVRRSPVPHGLHGLRAEAPRHRGGSPAAARTISRRAAVHTHTAVVHTSGTLMCAPAPSLASPRDRLTSRCPHCPWTTRAPLTLAS
jgi:hypothetical protein